MSLGDSCLQGILGLLRSQKNWLSRPAATPEVHEPVKSPRDLWQDRDSFLFSFPQAMEMMNSRWGLSENFTPSTQKIRGISFALFFSCVFSQWKELLEMLGGFVSKNLPKICVTILGKKKIYPLIVFHWEDYAFLVSSYLESKYMPSWIAQKRKKNWDFSNPTEEIMLSVSLCNFGHMLRIYWKYCLFV